MVAGLGAENSCVCRQGRVFVARDTMRIRVIVDRGRFLLQDLSCFIPE